MTREPARRPVEGMPEDPRSDPAAAVDALEQKLGLPAQKASAENLDPVPGEDVDGDCEPPD